MFNRQDDIKLKELMDSNPDFSEMVEKLQESHLHTLSKFSHEIRNPLTLISSSLQLIQSQHPEVTSFKYWNQTMEDIDYLKHLLNNFSNFIHSDRLKIHKINFLDVVISSKELLEARIINSGCNFELIYEENLPLIEGDPIKLKQVIINLVKNAYEAIEKEKGFIRMHLFQKDNTIRLEIKDNGCGIPEDRIPTLFTPFTTYKENGTGLGLSISKQIVEFHNGTLTLESEEKKGTKFIITLPVSLTI